MPTVPILHSAFYILHSPAALPYLDIIANARQRFDCPLAAYQVSGEYMMLMADRSAAETLDSRNPGPSPMMTESLTAIKRAGADIIITYAAKDAAKRLPQ